MTDIRVPDIPVDGSRIFRNYGYTESEDYRVNIQPYRSQGWTIVPFGEHIAGNFIVEGWRVLPYGSQKF